MVFAAQGGLVFAWAAVAFVLDFVAKRVELRRAGETACSRLGEGLLASTLSLFCAMPLSVGLGDRLRTFLVSTLLTGAGLAVVAATDDGFERHGGWFVAAAAALAVKLVCYGGVVHRMKPGGSADLKHASGIGMFAVSTAAGDQMASYGVEGAFACQTLPPDEPTTTTLGSTCLARCLALVSRTSHTQTCPCLCLRHVAP